MARTVDEVFSTGDVLGGRYRLERLIGAATAPVGTGLWRAEDATLARPVAVRVLVDPDARTQKAFLAAAARAGDVRDPRLAATYDADVIGSGRRRTAYLAREWVVGDPLTRLLADGGLDPARLRPLLCSVAEALAALHRAGGWHGRLHPDNVLVVDDELVRLTDAGTALALLEAGRPDVDRDGRPTAPPPLPSAVAADLGLGDRPVGLGADPVEHDALLRRLQRYDTCDLGRVAYAAATGTWPGGPFRGLPAAPTDNDRPLAPRRVRAAVPRDLDAVVCHVLLPAPGHRAAVQTAAGAAVELARLPAPAAAPDRDRGRRLPSRPRWLLPVLAVVSLLVLGIGGYTLGTSIGKVPGTTPAVPTFSPTASGAVGGGPGGGTIALTAVSAFDPPPGDGHENDDQIPLAHDGSTATAWTTQSYDAPRLGNLKPGVGLLVDLGSTRRVSEVDLQLQGSPTDVELRAADTRSAVLAGFALVTQQLGGGETVRLVADQIHRYWLVWLTSLPKVSGGYRGAIAEMVFRS